MQRGLVQRKKFQKVKRRKQSFHAKKIAVKQISPWVIKSIWIGTFTIVFVYVIIYILRITILAPEYTIKQVNYDPASIQVYDNPYVYKAISDRDKDKNYYVLRYLQRRKIERAVKEIFPIVKDVEMSYGGQYALSVQVHYHIPQLRVIYQELTFGLYQDFLFQVFSGNTIADTGALDLELPQYVGNITNFDGLFFATSPKTIVEHARILYDRFPRLERLVYLPGGQRMIVFLSDNKKLYFNTLKELGIQIKNYDILENHYEQFGSIYTIDLGSLEDDKVIISK